jgi:hypothetical protein
MCTHIVGRSGSVVHELTVLVSSDKVRVVHVVLEVELVERLVACKNVLVKVADEPITYKLTVENESVISHVVDCRGGSGEGCVCLANVKGSPVDCQ